MPRGTARAASETGAGRMLFGVRAVDVLRPMSDALTLSLAPRRYTC